MLLLQFILSFILGMLLLFTLNKLTNRHVHTSMSETRIKCSARCCLISLLWQATSEPEEVNQPMKYCTLYWAKCEWGRWIINYYYDKKGILFTTFYSILAFKHEVQWMLPSEHWLTLIHTLYLHLSQHSRGPVAYGKSGTILNNYISLLLSVANGNKPCW